MHMARIKVDWLCSECNSGKLLFPVAHGPPFFNVHVLHNVTFSSQTCGCIFGTYWVHRKQRLHLRMHFCSVALCKCRTVTHSPRKCCQNLHSTWFLLIHCEHHCQVTMTCSSRCSLYAGVSFVPKKQNFLPTFSQLNGPIKCFGPYSDSPSLFLASSQLIWNVSCWYEIKCQWRLWDPRLALGLYVTM